jgi:hypothetical protein
VVIIGLMTLATGNSRRNSIIAASKSAAGILPEDPSKVLNQEPDKPRQSMIFR